jgi:hypothetical protein
MSAVQSEVTIALDTRSQVYPRRSPQLLLSLSLFVALFPQLLYRLALCLSILLTWTMGRSLTSFILLVNPTIERFRSGAATIPSCP